MSRSLRFHPEAETELNDAADYYAPQSPGLLWRVQRGTSALEER